MADKCKTEIKPPRNKIDKTTLIDLRKHKQKFKQKDRSCNKGPFYWNAVRSRSMATVPFSEDQQNHTRFRLTAVKVLEWKQDACKHIETLKTFGVPIMKLNIKHKILQDNCRIHVANETREFFKTQNLDLISWSSNSPNLNLMENIWKILCDMRHKIYFSRT